MRIGVALRALESIGTVDVVTLGFGSQSDQQLARNSPKGNAKQFQLGRVTWSKTKRLKWAIRPDLPRTLASTYVIAPDRLRNHFMKFQYDLIYVFRSATLAYVFDLLPRSPLIVDIDDLEGEKLSGALSLARRSSIKRLSRLRVIGEHVLARRDAEAWGSLDNWAIRASNVALLCSPEDVQIVNSGKVRLVPNSFPKPPEPLGRTEVGRPPTVLLQGPLDYPPNFDAAQFFVENILPQLQALIPDVNVRLVGRATDEARRLHCPPTVTVAGYVPSMEEELRRSDLIIAPLRYGGGTRIKILEGLAHGIPIVSTSSGCYGLGLRADHDILIGDSPDDFARACSRALTNPDLRASLARSGIESYNKSFQEHVVQNLLIDIALGLVNRS